MGLNQWITARENPPHLRAIAPWISGSGGTEPSRNNGIVNLGVALNWILTMALEIADWQEKRGQDVSNIRRLLHEANANPEVVYGFLPLKDVPHFDFAEIKEIWTSRILDTSHDTPEYFEKNRTPYEKVNVPCFHVSGWYDFYPSGTLSHFQNMRQKGGSPLARKNQHIMMGPMASPGTNYSWRHRCLGFGRLASIRGSQLAESNLAFFDKYLKGKDINLPAVRYFVMGENVWQTADDWPLPQTKWQQVLLE